MIRQDLHLGHVIQVLQDLREDEKEQMRLMGASSNLDDVIVGLLTMPGPKWGYVEGADKAVLIGGFIPQRAGVYASWFLATDWAWRNIWRELTAEAINRKAFMFASGAHRIETVCLSSRKLAHRWYKTVGSAFESTLKCYCVDGSDAAMFVETRGQT